MYIFKIKHRAQREREWWQLFFCNKETCCYKAEWSENFFLIFFPDVAVKDNIETVDNGNHYNSKDNDNDKTEEELSESSETTSSTTESDVSDVEMDSYSEDPFAWDKQVFRNFHNFNFYLK